MEIKMNRAVLLNSGGLDSALLAKKLKDDGFEVFSLWVNTHAIYEKQARKAAEETARKFCVSHREIVIDLGQHSNFFEDATGIAMYDEAPNRTDKLWLCPVSPLLMCTLGIVYAKTLGASGAYAGLKHRADDFKVATFNQAAVIANSKFYTPPLVTPFYSEATYEDVLTKAKTSPEEFAYTHSCTRPVPCGTCYKCLGRAELGV